MMAEWFDYKSEMANILRQARARADALTESDIESDPSLALQRATSNSSFNPRDHFFRTVISAIKLPLERADSLHKRNPMSARSGLAKSLRSLLENENGTLACGFAAEWMTDLCTRIGIAPQPRQYNEISKEERAAAEDQGIKAFNDYAQRLTEAEILEDDYLKRYFVAQPGYTPHEAALRQLNENILTFRCIVNDRTASFHNAAEAWHESKNNPALASLEQAPLHHMLSAYFKALGIDPEGLISERQKT